MDIPQYFCYSKSKIKVFVLGADPTNFSDHDKPVQIDTVFGIGSGDHRYFDGILKNLEVIGLGLKDIYVQNLIHEPLESETARNKDWEIHAEKWLPITKTEFDTIDKSGKIPVLVTAERIMKFLYPDVPTASKIYSGDIFLPFNNNLFERPVYAFYRHPKYKLSIHNNYALRMKSTLM
jgi:hypothetical protein